MKEFIKENWWWMLLAIGFVLLLCFGDGGFRCQVRITSEPTSQPSTQPQGK